MTKQIQWLTPKVGYLPGVVNTGFLRNQQEVVIVDTGIDRDHGAKVLRALWAQELTPVLIVNTHSHADHCGGNAYLQKKCSLPVLAPVLEKAFIENPYLEPFGLFGAAHPPAALQNKFLKATPSIVQSTYKPEDTGFQFGSFEIGLFPLPGHSPQQTGVVYDGILFSADVLLDPVYLDKHRIPFNADVKAHRESLSRLAEFSMKACVPAHGNPVEKPDSLVKRNREALDSIDEWILCRAEEPVTLDQLLADFCLSMQVDMETISQYHLYRTALAAHLSALSHRRQIRHFVENSRLLWRTVCQ